MQINSQAEFTIDAFLRMELFGECAKVALDAGPGVVPEYLLEKIVVGLVANHDFRNARKVVQLGISENMQKRFRVMNAVWWQEGCLTFAKRFSNDIEGFLRRPY